MRSSRLAVIAAVIRQCDKAPPRIAGRSDMTVADSRRRLPIDNIVGRLQGRVDPASPRISIGGGSSNSSASQ